MSTRVSSLWDDTAIEDETGSSLEPGHHCDVAIVGGGYTGLSTALHCAEQGLRAHVIEAHHVGFGGSGRNVGLVNAGAWLPPRKVMNALGPEFGSRFLECFGNGPGFVFDLIEKHQIRCEATRSGTIHAAHSSTGMRNLVRLHEEWRQRGAPVSLLSAEQTKELTGTHVYHGGLLDHRAGTINPMGYCRGLARCARTAGARISADTRVTALRRDQDVWQVETEHGTVTADRVVLATNAYTDNLYPGLRDVFATIHYFQFATPPLDDKADHILRQRQGLWDTCPIMFSFRRDKSNRLVIGSMGRVHGDRSTGLSHRWARHRIKRVFPELGDVPFESAWHGKIAKTSDHLPKICQLADGLWTAIGYNGRGITTGTLFGKAMANLLSGTDPSDLPLPVTGLVTVPRNKMKAQIYDLVFTANQMWKSVT